LGTRTNPERRISRHLRGKVGAMAGRRKWWGWDNGLGLVFLKSGWVG